MNIPITDLFGKKLALLLWFLNEDLDTTAVVVSGVAFMHDGHLSLHRGTILPPVKIPLDLVWRARLVPDKLKDIVEQSDFCIQASMAEVGFLQAQA